jgi:hypothetical protein
MDTARGPATFPVTSSGRYRHEAFFYQDLESFLEGSLRFIGEASERAEPILVVVSAPKIEALRAELTASPGAVDFADMADVGGNPGRIIAAWQDFLNAHSLPSRRIHGMGEPLWAERSPAELAECQHHEALLNFAFGDYDFRLMCPYDESTLTDDILDEAHRTHPLIYGYAGSTPSSSYAGTYALSQPSQKALPSPPERPIEFTVGRAGGRHSGPS